MAALILVWVTARQRRPGLAVLAVLAWVSLYELCFNATQLIAGVGGQSAFGLVWFAAAVGVAPVFARHLGLRLWMPAALLWAGGMGVWLITGFHYNVPGSDSPFSVSGEVLNVLTKDGLGLAYLVGALRLEGNRRHNKGGDVAADDEQRAARIG